MSGVSRKRALLVGTANYQDVTAFPALPCTAADTSALEQVLRDPAVGQFDEVTVLSDPTAAEMGRQISEFLGNLLEEELGVLYISGHGHRLSSSTSEFHFVASDTALSTCEQTGVSASFVNEQLEESLSARKV